MARTGYKITVYLDDNPNSPTYGETYTARTLDSGACPVAEDDLVMVGNQCEIGISGLTGYRIITYYNRTTGEYTEVREEDPECEPSTAEEQWVNSGSPYCETTEQGLNTGYMLQLQVQVNQNLPNYGATRYSRYKSPECGGNGCASWNDIQTQCHIAVNDCVATFDGTEDVTQIDVNPLSETYNQTRTINRESSGNCQNCTETTFSWVDVGEMCGDDDMLCGEGLQQTPTTKYMVRQKYKTIGSGTPEPMGEYQITVVEEESEDCGYIRPITAWTATSEYVCDYDTHSKYVLEVQMISYDSGVTWSVVQGETRRGDLIMEHSYDCGEPMYRWEPTDDYVCVLDTDASDNYLTLAPIEDSKFSFGYNIYYSIDGGETWVRDYQTPLVERGNEVLLKAYADTTDYSDRVGRISSTGRYFVYGNAMSLCFGDDFSGKTESVGIREFNGLFSGSTNLVSAKYMVLPSRTLVYDLKNGCYANMFAGCTSLEEAPELPATTLADYCYQNMFSGCTSLTTTPSLPATIAARYCYQRMFYGCTNLTTVSDLLRVGYHSCDSMFAGCTSITQAPELPATALAEGCYISMFSGCTSLVNAPELPATTLKIDCYAGMFKGCTSLTTAPSLSAETLPRQCYAEMFSGCTNLNSIICLATDRSGRNCTYGWMTGVASSGTFTKAASMTGWPNGNSSGIPVGWTVIDV